MNTADTIIIQDLEVAWRIGVPDIERAAPQKLLISLEMEADFTLAAEKDDLARTINYHEVAECIRGLGNSRSWKLLETLAVDIAAIVLSGFPTPAVQVEIKKFILPDTAHVAVRLTRTRADMKASRTCGV